jgi:hypothetical protein
LTFLFQAIKSSHPYQDAVARARADQRVTQALGSPIEAYFYVSGNFSVSDSGGTSVQEADLAIPIYGPDGEGTLRVVGKKTGADWTYTVLQVSILEKQQIIDLLSPPP